MLCRHTEESYLYIYIDNEEKNENLHKNQMDDFPVFSFNVQWLINAYFSHIHKLLS